VSVVVDGRPSLTTEGSVGGYPSKIPMIDVVTVGAGGGSVAWVSPEGTLRVGPRSAGADPGPIAYAHGGSEPTVTDAHLVLGRIPAHLLGGEIPLDADAARAGIAALADRLGGVDGVEECAAGILEVSAWNQANALRQVTVKRGLDVRDFTLVAFGGSGALLACRLVDVLGVEGVLVPPDPGNLSASGLLSVDVRGDYVRTHVVRQDRIDLARVERVLAELLADADAALAREGFAPTARRFLRSADLRYFGQAFEVRVEVPDGPVTDGLVRSVAEAFAAEHRRLYGYDLADDPRQHVEWVNLRVTGVGPIRRPAPRVAEQGRGAEVARTGTRRTWFDRWTDTALYDRARLGAGDVVVGPAVVEEYGATVPVHPGYVVRVDEQANLRLTRDAR
jgi:N-methylhydantoinase A